MIHAGLSLLRLSPTVFWALTPVEFFAMTGGMRPRRDGLGRGGLEELMRRFPDG
ncbi:rcc01693 family protein [Agrobacterium rosae]|uniref:rcc01693 family protein n=1 Tax=Agrobacterium rosae TaxID=1972867 RepID=UPI003D7992A7